MRRLRYLRKLAGDFFQFARENKAYWLIPLLIVLALATLLALSASTATPFIYTLF